MHFFISEASWSKPYLLLDHWGKPLFTLLSSPFAHWSYTGILLFNLLVFTLTTVGAWRILKLLQVATLWKFVFPFVLLGSVQYNITILSGLTEPLFSLFLLWASYFYLNKKGLLAALLIGCLPFLRSEGQLPLILMVLLFVLNKEYKLSLIHI